ncbi:MAG: hypothetical protein LBP19_06945 [Treponema sp.]|nr:hypothetical protein [Treponema sp.]
MCRVERYPDCRVKANINVWNLPEVRITELEILRTHFTALYKKCQMPPHTTLDVQAKNKLKSTLVDKEKLFVQFHLQN